MGLLLVGEFREADRICGRVDDDVVADIDVDEVHDFGWNRDDDRPPGFSGCSNAEWMGFLATIAFLVVKQMEAWHIDQV